MLYHSIILLVCEFMFIHMKHPLKGGSPWSKLIFLCRRRTYLYGTIYLISYSIEDFPWYQLRTKPVQLDTRPGWGIATYILDLIRYSRVDLLAPYTWEAWTLIESSHLVTVLFFDNFGILGLVCFDFSTIYFLWISRLSIKFHLMLIIVKGTETEL